MLIIDLDHDPDSSRDTWEKLFQVIYGEKFGQYLDIFNIEDTETSTPKRWYAKINKNKCSELRKEYNKFKMAGDCDFNFNAKKIELYREVLNGEESNLLAECANMHHNLYNFSFMPITGNMQNVKGSDKYDRFDRFIYLLSIYYSQTSDENRQECQVLSHATKNNKPALMNYLSRFNSVFEYCREIYFIDESFVKKLITNYQNDIQDEKKAVIQYMNLAKEYWGIRKSSFKEKFNIEFS